MMQLQCVFMMLFGLDHVVKHVYKHKHSIQQQDNWSFAGQFQCKHKTNDFISTKHDTQTDITLTTSTTIIIVLLIIINLYVVRWQQ